jgi:hypothetical protein
MSEKKYNIIPFVPRLKVKHQEALDSLVKHYREIMKEPLPNPIDKRASPWEWKASNWVRAGRFIKIEHSLEIATRVKSLPPKMQLPDRTLEEIQALLLHFALTKNRGNTTCTEMLRALLLVEKVLRDRSSTEVANFTDLKASDLENAIQLSTNYTKSGNPIAPDKARGILVQTGVVTLSTVKNWVNSTYRTNRKKSNQEIRSLDNEGYKKLPNMQAVCASANYFANQPWLTRGEDPNGLDVDERNVIVSSVLAILSLVPCRYQELLKNLPLNCLLRQPESTVGEVLGIHWYADKTDMSNTKWVPYTASGEFERVIEEAVARLEYVTEGARTLLRRWDSECPEYDAEEYHKAKKENRLPEGWPYFEPKLKLRYSDSMFVCFKYQMTKARNTITSRVDFIADHQFRDWLRTKDSKSQSTGRLITSPGFFDRIGYQNLELNLTDYNSHSYRHMVNTAARLGGMSEFDVNMWSHRKEYGQGEVYNHMTGKQKRNLIVHDNHKGKALTPEERLDHINHGMPMTRKNLGMRFELIASSYGGFTFNHPLGTCIHNYVESPCMKSVDCVMCPENLHCKGDKRTLKNLQEELEQSNSFLHMALSNNDRRGAHRFEMRSEVLAALVEILGENSPLADGDLVILSPGEVPESGLLERARLAANHIKKYGKAIESQYGQVKAELGIDRSLPYDDMGSPQAKDALSTGFDSVIDDLLSEFEDED